MLWTTNTYAPVAQLDDRHGRLQGSRRLGSYGWTPYIIGKPHYAEMPATYDSMDGGGRVKQDVRTEDAVASESNAMRRIAI